PWRSWPSSGGKSSPTGPTVRTGPTSTWTSTRWSKLPRPSHADWRAEHSNNSRGGRPNDSRTSCRAPPAGSPAPWRSGLARSSRAGPPSPCTSPSPTAPPAAGTFSPQRVSLRLDPHGSSPSVLAKIVHAGATLPSFELAAKALRLLADIAISGRHVGRLTEAIGAELVAKRDGQAEAHRLRQLGVQVPNTPGVVVVEVDGGR